MNGLAPVENNRIQSLNYKHEAILVWLIENPHLKLRDCARAMNMTLPWISTVIHSDLFQAEYRKRCKERGDIAVHSTAARLGQLGAMAMEKLEERLEATGENAMNDQSLISVMNSTLDKLGFTPESRKGGGLYVENANVLVVSADDLKAARERALELHTPKIVEAIAEEASVRQ